MNEIARIKKVAADAMALINIAAAMSKTPTAVRMTIVDMITAEAMHTAAKRRKSPLTIEQMIDMHAASVAQLLAELERDERVT